MDNFIDSTYEDDVVGRDLFGYPFNKKYPPNSNLNGSQYGGYSTTNRETLFYSFAVQMYDLAFTYKGKKYYCLHAGDHVALTDEHFTIEKQCYKNGNIFIEEFEIEGKKLIDIIDELEDVDPR